jgi:hypothetical protein
MHEEPIDWMMQSHVSAAGRVRSMLGAGIEPAWDLIPRDFKSLASTGFATRAENHESARIGPQPKKRLAADLC